VGDLIAQVAQFQNLVTLPATIT